MRDFGTVETTNGQFLVNAVRKLRPTLGNLSGYATYREFGKNQRRSNCYTH